MIENIEVQKKKKKLNYQLNNYENINYQRNNLIFLLKT